MNVNEFNDALDRYGPDLSRWPTALQDVSRRLSENDTEAAASLEAARSIDSAVASLASPVSVDSALIGAITAGPTAEREATLQPTSRFFAWAGAGTVATLALGFVLGIAVPQELTEETLAGLMFGGTEITSGDVL